MTLDTIKELLFFLSLTGAIFLSISTILRFINGIVGVIKYNRYFEITAYRMFIWALLISSTVLFYIIWRG